MKLKSFKQYITEQESGWKEIIPGVSWDGVDLLALSEDMANWFVAHAGLTVTDSERGKIYVNEKYRKQALDREHPPIDYYLLATRKFIEHLFYNNTMFLDSEKTMSVPSWRYTLPENRKKFIDILNGIGANNKAQEITLDDKALKVAMHIENDKELYHFEKDITNKPSGKEYEL